MTQVRPRSSIGLWLLLLAAWWGFFHLAAGMLAGRYDDGNVAILRTVATWHGPHLDPVVVLLTRVFSPTLLLVLGVVTALILHRRGERLDASMIVLLLVGVAALTTGFKHEFQHFRPQIFPQLTPEKGYSFPSGHSVTSVAFFGYLALWFARSKRWLAVCGCLLLVVLVPASRIYVGVHWPTDVLAGACLGGSLLCAVLLLRRRFDPARYRRPPSGRRAAAR